MIKSILLGKGEKGKKEKKANTRKGPKIKKTKTIIVLNYEKKTQPFFIIFDQNFGNNSKIGFYLGACKISKVI